MWKVMEMPPGWSEGPWGRAAKAARVEVLKRNVPRRSPRNSAMKAESTKDGSHRVKRVADICGLKTACGHFMTSITSTSDRSIENTVRFDAGEPATQNHYP